MSTETRPVRIRYKTNLGCDVNSFYSCLQQITKGKEDCKVAIVGILGDKNSGKSTLLNIIAEYLHSEEKDDRGWMKNIATLSGFEVHDGKKVYDFLLEGILMYPRAFILKKPCDNDGSENVAVLLLDINLDVITPEMEIFICLLCSTLIYNKIATESTDISRILTLKRAILNCPSSNLPRDIAFQHVAFVFRDCLEQDLKCGNDKSLSYLSKIMTLKNNAQWKPEYDEIANKCCILLSKPIFDPKGQLQLDKAFKKQLKDLTAEILTIDNLPLKTVNGTQLKVKAFSLLHNPIDLLTPQVVDLFYKLTPPLETNLDESMDLDEQNVEEIMETDQEFHPNNQVIPEECHNQNGDVNQSEALAKSKLTAREVDQINMDLKFQSVDKKSELYKSNEKSGSSQLKTQTNAHQELAFNEATSSVNLEYYCHAAYERTLHKETERNETKHLTAENKSEVLQDDHPPSPQSFEDHSANFSNFIAGMRKYYSELMNRFILSNEPSIETLRQKHDSLTEAYLADAEKVWKGKINADDKFGEKIRLVLEQEYAAHHNTIEKHLAVQKLAKKAMKKVNANFAKNFNTLIESGKLLNTKTNVLFDELIKDSIRSLDLPHHDKSAVLNHIATSETKKCTSRLENMQNVVADFLTETKKKFQCHIFLTDEHFTRLQESASKMAEDRSQDDGERKFLGEGLKFMVEECKLANTKIIKHEEAALREVVFPRIQNFYNDEMKFMTKNGMTSSKLKNIHNQLKQECIASVKKACGYNSINDHLIQGPLKEIDVLLNNAFEVHSGNNEIKIDTTMTKIKLAIRRARDGYIDLMNNKINNQILIQQELERLHKTCFADVSTVLKIELRKFDEDAGIHINSLEGQVKSNFDFIVEENLKRKKREEDRKRDEMLEMNKRVAAEKIAKKRSQASAGYNNNHSPSSENTQTRFDRKFESNPNPTGGSNTESPIIAVEFGMKNIKCGIILDGKFTIIRNRWGDNEFPNNVAFTGEDDVLIGHEVTSQQKHHIKGESHLTETLLSPSDKLCSSPTPCIILQGETRQLTKELLCGLILSRIKSDAEAFLGTTVDSVVITVPLWYTSTQRKAVKDAGRIGGFSSVYLINEPTAVALGYANLESTIDVGSDNLLVIVANNDTIDVAVFEFNRDRGTAKMESCAGNFHYGNRNRSGTFGKFKDWIKTNILKEEGKSAIRSLVNDCVEKRKINEYALICEDGESYRNIKMIANVHCPETNVFDKFSEVIFGAAVFAHKLSKEDENQAKASIRDLLPYRFQYLAPNKTSHTQVFERKSLLSSKGQKNSFTFCLNENVTLKVSEYGNADTFLTGNYTVPIRTQPKGKRNVEVAFFLSSEGILSLTAHNTDAKPKEKIGIYPSCLYNMTEESVTLSASVVNALMPDPKVEEERQLFEDSRSQLKLLAQFMLDNLDQVTSVFGKDQMEKRASAAMDALAHPRVTLEDINNKTSVLAKLKSKYLA